MEENENVILALWDSYTKEMEKIYSLLIDGKSELSTILLREICDRHNGQSRDFLIDEILKIDVEIPDEFQSTQEFIKYLMDDIKRWFDAYKNEKKRKKNEL